MHDQISRATTCCATAPAAAVAVAADNILTTSHVCVCAHLPTHANPAATHIFALSLCFVSFNFNYKLRIMLITSASFITRLKSNRRKKIKKEKKTVSRLTAHCSTL